MPKEIKEKQKLALIIAECKEFVRHNFNLKPINNVNLVCEKIYETKDLNGNIIECGVSKGSSLFTIAQFCKVMGIKKKIIGFDTFGGFPKGQINELDKPENFKKLFGANLITKDHFQKAIERTKNFTDISHLSRQYFSDTGEVQKISKLFDDITLIKGLFIKTLPQYKGFIAVLFLDCDLYQSYKDCLEILYDKVQSKGVIIFDEYYSLKYPGPRVAVNEFFADKNGTFERYITEEGFERWCFVKV